MDEEDFEDAIQEFAEAFASHGRMNTARIRRWVNQFGVDRDFAVKILRNVDFVDGVALDGLVQQLADRVLAVCQCPERDIVFVPTVGAGSGAQLVARSLRRYKRAARLSWRVIEPLELARLGADQVGAVVLLDDFSGSGQTLEQNWLDTFEAIVRPLTSEFYAAVLILHPNAEDRLTDVFSDVIEARLLTAADDVLSNDSNLFTEPEKEKLRVYSRETGVSEPFYNGYGDCGLLLAFPHGCPNNSLPVLWFENDHWNGVFERRA